jgi:tRNA(Ile2) C34 agmatinyltransferase TiaS
MAKRLVDIKIREDGVAALRELAVLTNIKIADAVSLWPRCPQCGFLLQRVGKLLLCQKCGMEYKLC